MERTRTLFAVLLILCTVTAHVYAINCYGGSIVQTTVTGGYYDDYYWDLTSSNDEWFTGGTTYSSDFPYDFGYLVSGAYPADAIITFGSSTNSTDDINGLISSYGYDSVNSVDADGDYLCAVGYTDYPSSFPANTDYSYDGSSGQAAFLWVLNKTANPPYRIFSQTMGDDYEVDGTFAACSAKQEAVYVVSGSGYYNNYKRGQYDEDVRITVVDINSGYWNAEYYFGAADYDDYPGATKFFERGTDKFLMISGYTYSSGINDSFPVFNAYQNASAGNNDIFVWVANVNDPGDLTWHFATFFGGSNDEFLSDATVDESGNVYIVGGSYSSDLPLKNSFDSTYCGYSEDGCFFLAIFNLQGQLLMSTYLGVPSSGPLSIDVSRLSDGGHLVYLTGTTYDLNTTFEGYQYNITDAYDNYQDGYVKVFYISPQFTNAQVRLNTLFGGSDSEYPQAITVLSNNRFAISGWAYSYDLPAAANYSDLGGINAFTTVFQCGPGLYAVNPSPIPVASMPPPSPPPVTCQATDGCYSVPGVYVQFEQGDDGEYTPVQTLFPGSDGSVEEDIYLSVNYLTLEEKDANGNLIVSVPFPTAGYSLTSETQTINGVSVDVVTFSTYLLNGAGVDVINYFFPEDGTLEFAGTPVTVPGGTIKVSLLITAWNFVDPSNTLTLTILLDIAPEPTGPATTTSSGNQTQFTWDTGATDCVVTSLSVVELDDTTAVATTLVTSTTIQVKFPSFTDYVLYDPGYAVLVKDEQSSSSPKEEVSPWAYVGAALGAVVVVGVSVAIGYTFMTRKRRRTATALSFRHEEEMK